MAPAPSSLPAVVGGASGVVGGCGEGGGDLLRGQPVHLLEQGPGSGGCAQNAATRYIYLTADVRTKNGMHTYYIICINCLSGKTHLQCRDFRDIT